MMQPDIQPRFDSMATFGELLRLAGAAAANANSPTHRAGAVRDVDRLGSAWTARLSTSRANLAEAIVPHRVAALANPAAIGWTNDGHQQKDQ